MASSGKKKTTMAKLNRERKLREKKLDKAARKDARKNGLLEPQEHYDPFAEPGQETESGAETEAATDESAAEDVADSVVNV